jgi:hypothetical protein
MSIECLTFTVQSLFFRNHVSLMTLLAILFTRYAIETTKNQNVAGSIPNGVIGIFYC